MKRNILIVDDDKDILELLEYTLLNVGYDVIGFLNTKNVSKVLLEEDIDLILMDRNLPDIDGGLYVEMLRSKNINTPVIFVSAKASSEDIKNGFLLGADDYITKPFNMEELVLRIKAVLRRSSQESIDVIQIIKHKDMLLDVNQHQVNIESKIITLTKLETTLLHILIKNKNRVLNREFLIKHVWKDSSEINQKTVNVAMKRLKEKIDPLRDKKYIKTIRSVGYLLTV
ncbi:MAG: response regulator transcription factor [Campylobacterota bacterium]|nr:response regulator transcription factor [Campylobacterota bacterium]